MIVNAYRALELNLLICFENGRLPFSLFAGAGQVGMGDFSGNESLLP